ncbi:uncharacterized protein LOC118277163 [Spodoptera frugiperda]|uniref:Uncharacterized protein LOC118277163 n=1 Tax=Spodoptera frugiperda TaxID=7108 RepID=A0A9R0EWP9_SPOFR|nr:uncharacterized protein LOC118277163 [Spodoptera frugiperda]
MKTFIVIALLSALAACCSAAVLPNEEDMSGGVTIVYDDESPNGRVMSRNDFGSILDNYWVLLSEAVINVPAVPGKVQKAGMTYQAPPGVKISRISITLYTNLPDDVYKSPVGGEYIEALITSRPGDVINGTIAAYRRYNE